MAKATVWHTPLFFWCNRKASYNLLIFNNFIFEVEKVSSNPPKPNNLFCKIAIKYFNLASLSVCDSDYGRIVISLRYYL
jgi:hypothetical protein